MAYTVIEVEKRIGISSRKLRFWLDRGLFPFAESDSHGVRYFAQSDMEWARWIDWLRQCGMSLKEIKTYAEACGGGIKTASMRKAMLQDTYTKLNAQIKVLQEISEKLEMKIGLYEEMIEKGVDTFNPQSRDYKTCKKQC